MTLAELYSQIDGSYEQAISVLRVEKLIDKHIRKFPQSGIVERLVEAGKTVDATELFESAHALKGVCSNLGLVKIAAAASGIAEEFRPGNGRKMTDDEVKSKISELDALYKNTVNGINRYIDSVR